MKAIKGLLALILSFQAGMVSGQDADTDELVKDYYHYNVQRFDELDIFIHYGMGELNLKANNRPNSIDGSIIYFPNKLEPDIEFDSLGRKGILSVDIRSVDGKDDSGYNISFDNFNFNIDSDEFENNIDFRLPVQKAIELELDFGLGKANLDLTNLTVSELDLECGLSDVRLVMLTPNPVRSKRVTIENGLGDFNARGMGNIRAKRIDINVGLGSTTIDLTGQNLEDMDVEIEVGLGSLDLTIPREANTRIIVHDTFLSSVHIDELDKEDENEYRSRDWRSGLPTIQVEISVGLGSVDVDIVD